MHPCALLLIFAVASVLACGSEALRLSSAKKTPVDLLWPGFMEHESGAERSINNTKSLPETWRGKRLVFIGDSNDRTLSDWLFSQMGVQHKGTESTINTLNGGLILNGLGAITEKTYDDRDFVINYVWHGGVMSIPPQPDWHARQLQSAPWRVDIIPKWENGTKVLSSSTIALAALQHLAQTDKRPMIVVLQSSLWDSVRASEAIWASNMKRPKHSKFEKRMAFERWNWLGKASEFVRAVQSVEKTSRIEQIYWRTTANCPYIPGQRDSRNKWINSVTEKQAAAIRNAMSQRVPPWDNIKLIDWRRDYIATQCEGVHYTSEGYEALFNDLKKYCHETS